MRFDRILKKYLTGDLSATEKEKVDQWLDSLASPTDERNIEWDEKAQQNLLNKIKQEINAPKPQSGKITRRIGRVFWLKVAAGIALLTIVTWLLAPKVLNPVLGITDVNQNNIQNVKLNDGTIVWLKDRSAKISYYEVAETRERHARLTGEGLFEVFKDPSRPFIIECNDVSIEVLGTSFTLRVDADSVLLTVLTGKVKVYSAQDTINVLPNESVSYRIAGELMKTSASGLPDYVRQTHYNMAFENAPLTDVLTHIEKKYSVTIITGEHIKSCGNISADFTDRSLETTLAMIADIFHMTYVMEGSVVRITGTGCAG